VIPWYLVVPALAAAFLLGWLLSDVLGMRISLWVFRHLPSRSAKYVALGELLEHMEARMVVGLVCAHAIEERDRFARACGRAIVNGEREIRHMEDSS
jgi:hypothetical protein